MTLCLSNFLLGNSFFCFGQNKSKPMYCKILQMMKKVKIHFDFIYCSHYEENNCAQHLDHSASYQLVIHIQA